jgi:sugar diacid utilization regulator
VLGYDIERPHRVLVVTDERHSADDALFHAVRRSARDTGTGTLLVARASMIVVLADADGPRRGDWERLRGAVQREAGRRRCRVGVGDRCTRVADFPHSYRQAQLAIRVQEATGAVPQVAVFDELGVYQLFGELTDLEALEDFVTKWLGPLLDYDERKHSDLVLTLDRYLTAGGNYDASARAIGTHRSTLKYRLKRIREISHLDLRDPDTLFNLQLATRARTILLALRDV